MAKVPKEPVKKAMKAAAKAFKGEELPEGVTRGEDGVLEIMIVHDSKTPLGEKRQIGIREKLDKKFAEMVDPGKTALGRDTDRFLNPEPGALPEPTVTETGARAVADVQGPPLEGRTEIRNINLDRLKNNEDVGLIINEVAEQAKGFKEARRGKITHAETEAQAQEIIGALPWEREPLRVVKSQDGLYYVRNADGSLAHPHGVLDAGKAERIAERKQAERATAIDRMLEDEPKKGLWNAEQMTAARIVMANSADAIQKQAQWLTANEHAASPADWIEFRRAVAKHSLFQKSVQGQTAEIGRALSAFNIPVGAQGFGANNAAVAMEELLSATGGVGAAKDMARYISKADNLADVSRLASKSGWAKGRDVVLQIWINGILSGPVTHAKNMIGNSMVAAFAIPEKYAAAAAGGVRRALGGEGGVTAAHANGQVAGWMQGWIDGIRLAGNAARYGKETQGLGLKMTGGLDRKRAISAENFGLPAGSMRAKGVDFLGDIVVGWPGRMLMTEDEFFKGFNYRTEITSLAWAKADSLGIARSDPVWQETVAKLINEPSEDMYAQAMMVAQKNTFTDPISSGLIRGIQQGTGQYPLLKFILPFIRTPFNITKYAVERSPIQIFRPKFYATLKAGGAEADIALGKLAVGSGVFGAATFFAVNGQLTGTGPTGAMGKVWAAQGYQKHSIVVGDYIFSYNGLDPIGMQVAMVADTANAIAFIRDPDKQEEAAFAAALGMAEALTSKAYMQGVAELFEVLSTDHDAIFKAKRMSQGRIASLVPRWVSQVSTKTGDVLYTAKERQEFAEITGIPESSIGEGQVKRAFETGSYWGDLKTMVAHRSGYWNNEIPPRVDVLGRPVVMAGAAGPDAFMPTYESHRRYNPVLQALIDNGVAPSKPRATFTFMGGTINLHEDAKDPRGQGWPYFEHQRNVGKLRAQLLDKVINSKSYEKAPAVGDEGDTGLVVNRSQMLRRASESALAQAKAATVKRYNLQNLVEERRQEPSEIRINRPFEPLRMGQ